VAVRLTEDPQRDRPGLHFIQQIWPPDCGHSASKEMQSTMQRKVQYLPGR